MDVAAIDTAQYFLNSMSELGYKVADLSVLCLEFTDCVEAWAWTLTHPCKVECPVPKFLTEEEDSEGNGTKRNETLRSSSAACVQQPSKNSVSHQVFNACVASPTKKNGGRRVHEWKQLRQLKQFRKLRKL